MDLSSVGRAMVGAVALILIGFCLGSLMRLEMPRETTLSILGGAGVLLLLAARAARNGSGGR